MPAPEWVIYYDRNAVKMQGPTAGVYANFGTFITLFESAGASSHAYMIAGGPNGATTGTIGTWKKPAATMVPGDTIDIKIEPRAGDTEADESTAFNTFVRLWPNTSTR